MMKQIIRTYKTKQNAEHVTEYRNVLVSYSGPTERTAVMGCLFPFICLLTNGFYVLVV